MHTGSSVLLYSVAYIRHIKNNNWAFHVLFTFQTQDFNEIQSLGEKVGLACVKDARNGAMEGECPFHPSSFPIRSKRKSKLDLVADRSSSILGSLLTFALNFQC